MKTAGICALVACAVLLAADVSAQPRSPMGHAIDITAVEFKGSMTTDKLPYVERRDLARISATFSIPVQTAVKGGRR